MMSPTFPEVNIYKDTQGHLELIVDFYKAPWKNICDQVNRHNDKFVSGEVDWMMRVFCPWDGELHIPR